MHEHKYLLYTHKHLLYDHNYLLYKQKYLLLVIYIYCADVNIYCPLYQNTCNIRSKIVLSITRINLRFMLLNGRKDAVFAQILVFSNILVFLGVHWAWKRTKIVKFWVRLVSEKIQNFWKILQKLFLSSWSLPPLKMSAKLNHIWGLWIQTLAKKDNFMDAWQRQMFY